MRTILIIALFITSLTAFGQGKEQLAHKYLEEKQYQKAVVLFEELYKDEPETKFYAPYLKSLLFLEDYKQAEKLVKKHLKRNPEKVHLNVDLGYVYKKAGDEKKSIEAYDQAIKDLIPNASVILSVGNSFLLIQEYDYSIQAYQRGGKLLEGDYPFAFELAKVYEAQGNFEAMSDEILGVLEFGPAYLDQVKNTLINLLEQDASGKIQAVVKKGLILKVQKHPNNTAYVELLIWLYLQDQNYSGALIQAKALDKRLQGDGRRVLDIGDQALQNKAYEPAIMAYNYVIESKEGSSYFTRKARLSLVAVYKAKLADDLHKTQDDLAALRRLYESTLKELGEHSFTVNLMREYAELLAFEYAEYNDAKSILSRAINMPRVKPYDLAAVKISLGDVYLAEGEIWEAVLLYGQVNQDFKEDAIGHEAKLRTATAYYYTGDFGWAKSQLDVLKSSSSKLIANDAMKLSILISDVLSIDTAVAPLQMYARADLLAYQGRDSMAQIVLDSVLANYPKHYSILDEVYFKKAELYKKHQDWTKAKLFYNKTVEQDDLLKDDALFKLAWIAEFIDQDLEKAQALYERIILEHDDSVFMIQARKRFRALRGS